MQVLNWVLFIWYGDVWKKIEKPFRDKEGFKQDGMIRLA